jgi:hypothetical protein
VEKERQDVIVEKIPPVPQPQESKNVNNREHREPVPSSADDDKQQIVILKQQLEQEKATVFALQNQKQAITKDLDYLHLTVETLENEKMDLIQQLEDEKVIILFVLPSRHVFMYYL